MCDVCLKLYHAGVILDHLVNLTFQTIFATGVEIAVAVTLYTDVDTSEDRILVFQCDTSVVGSYFGTVATLLAFSPVLYVCD
jgi:hypothetical protein